MKFGKKLRQCRLEKKLSMNALSKLSGVSSSYISDLENGKNNRPSVDILYRLADALGVSRNELLDEHASSNNIGSKIKAFKIICKLTDTQLSEKTGIDEIDLRAIQDGKINPTKAQLDLIAKALNLPVEKLLEGSSVNISKDGNITDIHDIETLEINSAINMQDMNKDELISLVRYYQNERQKNTSYDVIKENQVKRKNINEYADGLTSDDLKEKIKYFLDNELITLDDIVKFQLLSENLVSNSLLNGKDKRDFIKLCNLLVNKWCENMSQDEISKLKSLYNSKKK
ncbi:hypothetical protein GCM10008916_25330 [Clostridium nitritogenes]|uniref:HTH cro/C1-type domain-containing protein n=1 Tax=Clostridium nitritogenes TaxID=83340 RepID=A0ABN1LU56_9CLOT